MMSKVVQLPVSEIVHHMKNEKDEDLFIPPSKSPEVKPLHEVLQHFETRLQQQQS